MQKTKSSKLDKANVLIIHPKMFIKSNDIEEMVKDIELQILERGIVYIPYCYDFEVANVKYIISKHDEYES